MGCGYLGAWGLPLLPQHSPFSPPLVFQAAHFTDGTVLS